MGSYSLLQGFFSTQGSNPGLPYCRCILTIWATREAKEYWGGSLSLHQHLSQPRNRTGNTAGIFFTSWATREAWRMFKLLYNCTHFTCSQGNKIFQARLQQYVNQELPDVQARFRKGRGNHQYHWIIEKTRSVPWTSSYSLTAFLLLPLTSEVCFLSPEKPVCWSRSNS